jgi:small subunit ribosomal protein S15
MVLEKTAKTSVIKEYQQKSGDTGSCEVQVALLTSRINELTGHFQAHQKDHHSRFGLIRLVERRKKLLTYLERIDTNRYKELIKRLDLRK